MSTSSAERSREQVQALADQLYRERDDYLLRIAKRNAANHDDAAEAVQFAFLAFIEHFDPDSEAPPLAWLTLTLKRECWAKYRHEHFERRTEKQPEADVDKPGRSIESNRAGVADPEEAIERAELVAEAHQRLAALKPAERRTLVLIAAGYSYKEIAAMNDWTYTKVNRCASEGRAALRSAAPLD